MSNTLQVRRALAYLRQTEPRRIANVYITNRQGDVVSVSYRGPKGKKRTAELDLSKQYMKMFEESL
jgi:hypothetical protein